MNRVSTGTVHFRHRRENPRAFAKFTMFFLDTIATFKENRNFAD
jgi:hypothetical protein